MRGQPFVIVLCSGRKAPGPSLPAGERYTGSLHRLAMQAARALTSDDRIRVMSARFGLLELDQPTPAYNVRVDQLAAEDLFALKSRCHVDGIRFDHEDPTAPVIALVPAAYLDVLRWSPMLDPKLVTPLAGSAGIGEMRGRLAAIRDGRSTLDELTATDYQCNQPRSTNQEGTPVMSTTEQSQIDPTKLGDMTLKQLQAVARANGVPFSRVKQADLVEALTAKAKGETPAPKAEASPRMKSEVARLTDARKAAEAKQAARKAAETPAKAAKGSKATAPAKAPEKATEAPEKATYTQCELCGFQFSKPRGRARCSSEGACKARQEGKPTRGKGTGSKSSKEAKEAAAREGELARQAAGKEHKAVKAWEAAGKKGKRPDTPHLDAMHAEAEAKKAS